jgi:hypothetical protein
MKVVRTIGGHLKLLARLAWARLTAENGGTRPSAPAPLDLSTSATSGTSPMSV